ncbi:MAG: YicC/YloC family endoribonuclease [Ignavibacteriaceae bacterium]
MICSMTGYGKGKAENSSFSVEVEIKSINSRYLDIFLKLPSNLISKDIELRELIKNKLSRGKLSVSIQVKQNRNDNLSIIDKEKLNDLVVLIKSIKKAAKIDEKIKISHFLDNKEMFLSDNFDVPEEEFNVIREALNAALAELKKMKKNEGRELAKDLHKRIDNIGSKLSFIEGEAEKSVKVNFDKFKERMKLLIEDTATYNDRLELELAVIAERADITEECIRLRSHLKFFLESIDKDEEPGRKLNFLCQEMNRETNTISSKSISTDIVHNTVLIKEEIEKIREQIQNIE